MQIELFIDKDMSDKERESFMSEFNKCKSGTDVNELFDRYNGLYKTEPNSVYIFSRNKRFEHHGNIELEKQMKERDK